MLSPLRKRSRKCPSSDDAVLQLPVLLCIGAFLTSTAGVIIAKGGVLGGVFSLRSTSSCGRAVEGIHSAPYTAALYHTADAAPCSSISDFCNKAEILYGSDGVPDMLAICTASIKLHIFTHGGVLAYVLSHKRSYDVQLWSATAAAAYGPPAIAGRYVGNAASFKGNT